MADFEIQLGQLLLEHTEEDPIDLLEVLDQYAAELEEKAERSLIPRPA